MESVPYGIFYMKDPDNIMEIIATYGRLTVK